MDSRTTSCSDIVFPEEGSVGHDDVYSPPSTYSTYSQEVKYIFDPSYGGGSSQGDTSHDEYSQIQFPTHRTSSQSHGHYSHQPVRTSSTSSCLSEYTYREMVAHNYRSNTAANNYSLPHHYPYHHSRRRTWSPEGLKMGIVGSFNGVQNFHSIEQLDNEGDVQSQSGHSTIEESAESGPPRLAPVSGILTRSPARGIIRPIAFKPVVRGHHKYASTPRGHGERKSLSHDDGYSSQDYHLTSHNVSNISHGSVHMDSDRSASFSSDCNRPCDRPDSLPSSNLSRVSSNRMEGYVQTPSPSDSGVGELEAMLKEKDAEINTLREVMDKNERAIFQVYEEKKSSWSRDLREVRDDYDRKLKIQQRKAYKTEQVLSLQIYKLQQEKKGAKEEYDKLFIEKEDLVKKCEAYAAEVDRLQSHAETVSRNGRQQCSDVENLRKQVNELHSKLAQKSEEVLSLQTQLEDRQTEVEDKDKEISDKFREILSKTEEVKALRANINRLSSESDPELDIHSAALCEQEAQTDSELNVSPIHQLLKPSLVSEQDRELKTLKDELQKLKQTLGDKDQDFEKERLQWVDEKNKVIRYQKQLQLNYVQMYRKNNVLEAEVEQLTLELETRDMKLMALNGGEESVC